MKQKRATTRYLAQAAMIAALYTVFTLVAVALGWAFGPVQFRFSEAMTILPVFTPAAVPGLAVGCLLSNLWSNMGVADMVFGTLATLLAAIVTRMLRNLRLKGLPVMATLPPVLFNAVIVGLEIALLSPGGFVWPVFWISALQVGLGQLVACVGLGLPLSAALNRSKLAKKSFEL